MNYNDVNNLFICYALWMIIIMMIVRVSNRLCHLDNDDDNDGIVLFVSF